MKSERGHLGVTSNWIIIEGLLLSLMYGDRFKQVATKYIYDFSVIILLVHCTMLHTEDGPQSS